MCGIALIHGPGPDRAAFRQMIGSLAPRGELEATRLGHRLRTDSDTEVVLEAFLEWGAGAVSRLRGEFAFALADTAADRVYLARDPLGVKPLYWSRRDGCLH